MAYPDWVLKHKVPGTYVQKKDEDTYRIYRGHSERRPGKTYPVYDKLKFPENTKRKS